MKIFKLDSCESHVSPPNFTFLGDRPATWARVSHRDGMSHHDSCVPLFRLYRNEFIATGSNQGDSKIIHFSLLELDERTHNFRKAGNMTEVPFWLHVRRLMGL